MRASRCFDINFRTAIRTLLCSRCRLLFFIVSFFPFICCILLIDVILSQSSYRCKMYIPFHLLNHNSHFPVRNKTAVAIPRRFSIRIYCNSISDITVSSYLLPSYVDIIFTFTYEVT